MAKGCVGPFLGTRFLLNDTGMLMYDIMAPFLGSFPHMVNSFSRPVSGQFTEGTEALLRGDFSSTYSSRAAAAAVAETPNRNSVVGSGCIFLWFHVKHGTLAYCTVISGQKVLLCFLVHLSAFQQLQNSLFLRLFSTFWQIAFYCSFQSPPVNTKPFCWYQKCSHA